MTISYIAVGALSEHTDTIAPAYPAGADAGRLAILQVVSARLTDTTPSTPSGWTLAGSASGGGGVFGLDTGPRRLTWFVRVLAGSDAVPTTAIASGDTGSLIAGRIVVLSRSAGTGWRWATTFGEDATAGTGFSALCTDARTWAVGDMAILGYGIRSDAGSLTAEAVTATGITFGTVTERADDAVTSGHDARLGIATGSVTAGSGTQAPTVAATLAIAHTGVAGVLRIREATATIAATGQAVFPPRVLVSVTGMLADDIVTATIYRVAAGVRSVLRGADAVDATGDDALVRVDGEQPFGVAVTYIAELTDDQGTRAEIESSSVTSTVAAEYVLSDAITAVGVKVVAEAWADKRRGRDGATFNVGGRWVAVLRPRSGATSTLVVRTDTVEDGDALQSLLDGATSGVVLIRQDGTVNGVDAYLAVLDDGENREWWSPRRRWSLDTVEVEPWPGTLEARGFTLQDIATYYGDGTLQDIADDNPGTLLDIAQRDWSS